MVETMRECEAEVDVVRQDGQTCGTGLEACGGSGMRGQPLLIHALEARRGTHREVRVQARAAEGVAAAGLDRDGLPASADKGGARSVEDE